MDLYHIPGDTGGLWRIDKLLDYKHYMPYVDTEFLCGYAKNRGLSWDDLIVLSWYHSLTYSEISAVYLFQLLPWRTIKKSECSKFWDAHKMHLQFSSSRVYVKNMNWFMPLMVQFMKAIKHKPFDWFCSIITDKENPFQSYKEIHKALSQWRYMGNFSIELFLITLIEAFHKGLFPIKLQGDSLDWRTGANVTSGMFNMLYLDEEALQFERGTPLSSSLIGILDEGLYTLVERVKKRYPEDDSDVREITPKICPYRNLFKKSRYGGFHHDRQLEQIIAFENSPLRDSCIQKEIFQLRKSLYPSIFLGEIGGWNGIRKERKSLFLDTGRIGFEELQEEIAR